MGLFGSILGAGASILGGVLGSSASKKAAKYQYQASREAIGEQRRQFDLARGDYLPFMETGLEALGEQGNILGLNGTDEQSEALASLKASPLFQSLFGTGEEAILQNAAATGGLRGGNTQRGLADFGADTFARVIQQQLANLGGISGMGQSATDSISNIGQQSATNIGNFGMAGGQARAQGALGSAAAWNQAISGVMEALGGIKGF